MSASAVSPSALAFSWSESLVESLQRHFLPGTGESLRPLAVGLAARAQKLQEAQTRLEDAAKENTQTHVVMKATNALLGRYQVCTQAQAQGQCSKVLGRYKQALLLW